MNGEGAAHPRARLRSFEQMDFDEELADFVEDDSSKLLPRETVEKEVDNVRQVGENVLGDGGVEADLIETNLSVGHGMAGALKEGRDGVRHCLVDEEDGIGNIEEEQRQGDGEEHASDLGAGSSFERLDRLVLFGGGERHARGRRHGQFVLRHLRR